ncbi:DNA-processing protein DprA [candidate division WOR-3 bacterium]|nr:DNA-processing protein DprA [candidate division WOR-3 bacterium]
MENEVETLIKLSNIKGLTERKLKRLIPRFKPISRVFNASQNELSGLIGRDFVLAVRKSKTKNVEAEISLLKELKIDLITFKDSSWPLNLKSLPDSPPFLFIRGKIIPEDQQAIAIIGSRRATPYGRFIAEKFAYELASSGITIISGLARGIDSCAHKGALRAGGRTIAVLGCGIDVVYPPENRLLMQEIISHGACISEFPIGDSPWAGNFPARNRLISGLSKAIVVIEAATRSGVFSTVEWALGQNKEVFAVPGNITSEASKGTNRLIMDGAQPVTSPQDILEYMGIKSKAKEAGKLNLSEEESKVFNLLNYEPKQVDNLAEALKIKVSKILGILLNLELRGVAKQLPGRNFVKNI